MNDRKFIVKNLTHQSNLVKGEVVTILGFCRGGNDTPYAVVLKETGGLEMAGIWTLKAQSPEKEPPRTRRDEV